MHSSKSLFLSIDQGGHASRAVVYDLEGEIVASCSSPLTTRHPHAHYVEHDAQALLDSIQQSLVDVINKLGERAKYIDAFEMLTESEFPWK